VLAAAVTGADIVIEAVPEKLELKHALFCARSRDRRRRRRSWRRNTSSLSLSVIAAAVPVPGAGDRHALLQPGARDEAAGDRGRRRATSAATLVAAQRFGARSARTASSSRTRRASRRRASGWRSASRRSAWSRRGRVAGGHRQGDVLGYGFPMGPLRLTDLVGLDVRLSIAEYLCDHLPDGGHFRPPALLRSDGGGGQAGQEVGRGVL
jgi:3-hydroxybutyryl-CoA dehydrogenase